MRAGLMPPSPLDGFQEDGRHAGVGVQRGLDGGQVVERHTHETRHQRPKARLDLAIGGGRQRGDGAAMEGALEDDHRRFVDALVVPELAAILSAASLASSPLLQKKTLLRPEASHSKAASCSCSGT